jgi:hypothetical protein
MNKIILLLFILISALTCKAQTAPFCDSTSLLNISNDKINNYIDSTLKNSLIENDLWSGNINFYEVKDLNLKYKKDSVYILLRGFEAWSILPTKEFYDKKRIENSKNCLLTINKKEYLILESNSNKYQKIEIYFHSDKREEGDVWTWCITLQGRISRMKKENYLDIWNLLDEITEVN